MNLRCVVLQNQEQSKRKWIKSLIFKLPRSIATIAWIISDLLFCLSVICLQKWFIEFISEWIWFREKCLAHSNFFSSDLRFIIVVQFRQTIVSRCRVSNNKMTSTPLPKRSPALQDYQKFALMKVSRLGTLVTTISPKHPAEGPSKRDGSPSPFRNDLIVGQSTIWLNVFAQTKWNAQNDFKCENEIKGKNQQKK